MTESFAVLGRADPLGHIYLSEMHRRDDCMADRRDCMSDDVASTNEDALRARSAKSIVLSARTHVPTGF